MQMSISGMVIERFEMLRYVSPSTGRRLLGSLLCTGSTEDYAEFVCRILCHLLCRHPPCGGDPEATTNADTGHLLQLDPHSIHLFPECLYLTDNQHDTLASPFLDIGSAAQAFNGLCVGMVEDHRLYTRLLEVGNDTF